MSKPVILTGLRANNDLHLGNYLGALLPMVQLQKKYAGQYQINLFVPDLHSFTTPIDHSKLYDQTMHNVKLFVAAGLDLGNEDTFVYRQSYIPAHSELTVILNCFTYMGELLKMTQFKDKSQRFALEGEKRKLVSEYSRLIEKVNQVEYAQSSDLSLKEAASFSSRLLLIKGKTKSRNYQELIKNNPELAVGSIEILDKLLMLEEFLDASDSFVTTGLFDYPVLMAADILLYGAKYVPVGADQTQHVELARDIAIRMNNKFGDLFTPPEAEKEQIAFAAQQERLRIRDLVSPEKKMSKSDETGKGVIFLGDSPEVAAKKIMSATTDSFGEIRYDHKERPGVSNLLDILAALTDRPVQELIAEYEGQNQYGPLKSAVADATKTFLTEFQAKLTGIDETELLTKLKQSELAMNEVANQTLLRVQKAVGLRKVA